jgi:GNAT superfamily N-acetyltransferase
VRSSSDARNTGEMVIRSAGPSDRPAILELVKRSLGEGLIPRDLGFWSWKHERNPFGPSAVLVAEANGQLVGLRVFLRWCWAAEGRQVDAVRAVDTATHPDWQGRGIFSRLTLALVEQMTQEGVALVFNTPNQKSGPGYLKMGWSAVGRMALWVRPMRPLRILDARLRPSRAAEEHARPREAASEIFPTPGALLDQPGTADLLARSVDSDTRLITVLTPAYLQWRYVDVPGFEYHAAWAFEGGEGAALVFRLKRQGSLRELRLCEVITAPSSRSVRLGARLIRDVVRQADADFASGIGARGAPEQRALLRAGFFPVPRAAPLLTVRPLCRQALAVDALKPGSWRLSIGTLELF